MKKFFSIGITLLLLSVTLAAQPQHSNEGRYYLGIQQGPMMNLYENAFTYFDNGKGAELLTGQVGLVFGYDVNDIFGIRVSGAYAKNSSACNVLNTSGGGFYPYTFSSVNAFLDAILDMHGLADRYSRFRIKLYGGAGVGYSFKLTESGHPWQVTTDPNIAFGFRFGSIFEYNITNSLGLYADIVGEGYQDNYNGLQPAGDMDREDFKGYGGFPFDLRFIVSIGFIFRFGR